MITDNTRHILLAAISSAAILLIASCSGNEDTPSSEDRPILFGLESATSSLQASRAGTDVPGELPLTVGIYGYNTTDNYEDCVFDNHKLYYKDSDEARLEIPSEVRNWPLSNDWVYTPRKYWKEGKDYIFYAYAPFDGTGNASLFWNSTDGLYQFTLQRIPPVSALDYMVANNNVAGKSTLVPRFIMQHLTARIRFNIKIHEEYLTMRDIVVTGMSISDTDFDGVSCWKCDKDLSVADSQPIITAVAGETYTAMGNIDLLPETTNRSSLKLTDSYQTFSSIYCMPVPLTSVTLTVTYDVFDKKGVKTRSGQSTSNPIDLSGFGTPLTGKYYDVRVLVKPKYLYVLSDNDVQPDGLIDIE